MSNNHPVIDMAFSVQYVQQITQNKWQKQKP